MKLDQLQKAYDESRDKAIEDFFTFLKFQSISSELEQAPKVRECGDWVQGFLDGIGFHTELWETMLHPVIFAQWTDAGEDKPTILIYNHYDVQPVDPIEEWESGPFEPTIRDGEVYARGAQDNKGQCFYVLHALRLLMEKEGKLPVNVKLFIEGAEEIGSTGSSNILEQKKEDLKADYLAIVDMGIHRPNEPAVTLGVRGISTLEVEVQGSNTDLHSGSHGGIVYNPLHALSEMIAKLRDEEGTVLVPGFYDDVEELSDEDRNRVCLEFSENEYEEMFGAKPVGGERAYSPVERACVRPTVEVNGLWGGYTGDGFKTVIPAKAHAKISCRVVPHQDPDQTARLVGDYLEEIAPEGVKVKVNVHQGAGGAVRASVDSKVVKAFANAYEEIFRKPCKYIFEGGSIPIVPALADASGGEVVLVGLGLPDDQIHAPNEHFGLDRIERGVLLIGRTLDYLSQEV